MKGALPLNSKKRSIHITLALSLCALSIMTNFADRIWTVKYLMRYGVLLIAAIMLLYEFVKNNMRTKFSVIPLLWCPFFIYSFLRMDINSISDLGLVFIYLFSLCLIWFGKGCIDNFIFPLRIIFFISLIYALTTILQLFAPYFVASLTVALTNSADFGQMTMSRRVYLSGVAGSVAYSAGYAAVAIAYLMQCKRFHLKPKFFYTCFLIQFTSLVLSGKRAHFVFCFAAIFYTFWVTSGKRLSIQKLGRLILLLAAVAGAISVVVVLFPDLGVFSRFSSTMQAVTSGSDIGSGRSVLFQRAWELFLTNPFWGIGWGNFDGSLREVTLSVHNSYLQLLCETGIAGLVLFIIPLAATFVYTERKLRKSVRYNAANITKFCLSISLYIQLFFILYSLTGSIVLYPIYILLYSFACAMALSANYKNSFQEQKQ